MRHVCSFLYIPFPFSNGLPGLDCISALIELVFQSFTRYGLKKRYIATHKTTLSFSSHAHIREVSFFWGSHMLVIDSRSSTMLPFSAESRCWLTVVNFKGFYIKLLWMRSLLSKTQVGACSIAVPSFSSLNSVCSNEML